VVVVVACFGAVACAQLPAPTPSPPSAATATVTPVLPDLLLRCEDLASCPEAVGTDPGSKFDELFTWPVYARGAMTLQQLRVTIGDEAFFELLPTWAAKKHFGNGTTAELRALAEEISKVDLSGLFETWLEQPTRPDVAPSENTYSARPASWEKLQALRTLKH